MTTHQKRWKHKIVWSVCDSLVEEKGLRPQDVTDSKLVEGLKEAGHAPGNPNQRLRYLKEWKLNQLNCDFDSDDSYGSTKDTLGQVNQSLIDSMTRKFEHEYQEKLEERDNEIVYTASQLAHAQSQLNDAETTKEELLEEIETLKQSLNESHEAKQKAESHSKILEGQLHDYQKQTESVEFLLERLTSANEEIVQQKTQALKNEYEVELIYLRQQKTLLDKILSEKDALIEKLETDKDSYQKKYILIKEGSDNWEGEKKRLQIELAKSRSKQFTNEFQQFTESYKSFTQKFMNDSQQQSHKYITQCFERLLKLVSFEMQAIQKIKSNDLK